MSRSDVECASLAEVELRADPVNPDWVIEGRPIARSATLSRSSDDAAGTAVWDCTAGTFRWYFGVDEIVHILEGEVRVRDAAGHERALRAGDVALFRARTWATWTVDRYVRKLAFYHQQVPIPIARALAAARWLRSAVGATRSVGTGGIGALARR